MRVIVVGNQKGGTGKTTVAAHLAVGLALQEARVLAVDLDAQGNLARMLGRDAGPAAARWLRGGTLNGDVVLARKGLGLVAADKSLEPAVVQLLVEHGGRLPRGLIGDRLAELKGLDFVVVDTAPTATQLQAAAMAAADLVVVPAACDYPSQLAVLETVRTLRVVKNSLGFVLQPTFYEQVPNYSRDALQAYREHAPAQTLAPIHRAAVVAEAAALGRTVFETARLSRAADEFRTMVWAVRGRVQS